MEVNALAAVDFQVKLERIQTLAGVDISKKRAVVRTDTGQPLGVVSSKYHLVSHSEVLKAVQQVSVEFGLALEVVTCCKGGSVFFGRFLSQNGEGSVEVKVGDVVRTGIEVVNSYDGTMPVGVMLVAYRLSCKNSMVVPRTLTSFWAKHFPSLSLSTVREKLSEVLSESEEVSETWRRWSQTVVTDEKVREFFGSVFGHRRRSQLFMRYLQEREDSTVWGTYNFLTRYWTHELKTQKGKELDLRWSRWQIENPITSKFYEFSWN